MVITKEESDKIKEHLLNQLENFPEEQRDIIKQKILSMTKEEVESFVKQNQLNHLDNPKGPSGEQQCIFCAIVEGKIPSYIIDENEENIAILELNPLSKGHCLVVPKKHVEEKDIPKSTSELTQKIVNKFGQVLKPIEIKVGTQQIMGHSLMEIIPIYGDEKERSKASEEDLIKLQEILKQPIKEETPQEEKVEEGEKPGELPVLKPRIP